MPALFDYDVTTSRSECTCSETYSRTSGSLPGGPGGPRGPGWFPTFFKSSNLRSNSTILANSSLCGSSDPRLTSSANVAAAHKQGETWPRSNAELNRGTSGLDRVQILERVLYTTGPEA